MPVICRIVRNLYWIPPITICRMGEQIQWREIPAGALRRPNRRGRFQTCPYCTYVHENRAQWVSVCCDSAERSLLPRHCRQNEIEAGRQECPPHLRVNFLRVQAYVWRSHFAPGEKPTCHSECSLRISRSRRCKCERDLRLPIRAKDRNQYKKNEKSRGAGRVLRPFLLWMSVQMRLVDWSLISSYSGSGIP